MMNEEVMKEELQYRLRRLVPVALDVLWELLSSDHTSAAVKARLVGLVLEYGLEKPERKIILIENAENPDID